MLARMKLEDEGISIGMVATPDPAPNPKNAAGLRIRAHFCLERFHKTEVGYNGIPKSVFKFYFIGPNHAVPVA